MADHPRLLPDVKDAAKQAFRATQKRRDRKGVPMVKEPQPRRRPQSAAAMERERRYAAWLIDLPDPVRDDQERDDSWERFMAEERRAKEKARLQRIDEKRKAERHRVLAERKRRCEEAYKEALQRGEVWALREEQHRAKSARRKASVGQPVGGRVNPSLPTRKRGRPADPHRDQRKRQQLDRQVEQRIADAMGPGAVRAAEAERKWFQTQTPATMGLWLRGEGRLCALQHQRWYKSRGLPNAAVWWRQVAQKYSERAHERSRPSRWTNLLGCSHNSSRIEKVALAAARARAADAKALEAAALEAAAADADSADAEAASAAAAKAVCVAAAARAAEVAHSAYTSGGRARGDAHFFHSFEAALAAEGVTDVDARVTATAPKLEPLPTPARAAWSTEGQCEGVTRDGERCKVHKSSKYAVAAPLRRGERYCGHHHPDKYTGVRCAGMKKHGKGRCRVWSGSCYADAAPLRRGSLFCHHHRVRCAGCTRTGTRCAVTSSCEHEHAEPLRRGELYCAHHRDAATSANSDGFVLYDCDHCDYLCAVRVGEDPGVEHVCESCTNEDKRALL